MRLATAQVLRECWQCSVGHLAVERAIVLDPLHLVVDIEGDQLLERKQAEVILHQGGRGSRLHTVRCRLELEAQTVALIDQDRTPDLPMEDLCAVTSKEVCVPVVIHASIHTAKSREIQAQSLRGDQCLRSLRSQAFASTMHVESARGTNAHTNMRGLRPPLKCQLLQLRVARRGGLTVLLRCLRIFERGVPRPSGSLGNDLWF